MVPGPLSVEIRALAAAREFRKLRDALAARPAADLAGAWGGLSPVERIAAFKVLNAGGARALAAALPPAERGFLLGLRETGVLGPVLEGMTAAEAAELFPRLSDDDFGRLAAEVSACT